MHNKYALRDMPLTIDREKITRLKDLLVDKRNILIISHNNPDGDALGSLLGISLLLKKHLKLQDENIHRILPSACQDTFSLLPDFDKIAFADRNMEACTSAFEKADIIIAVDFNNASRVGILQPMLEEASQPKILIDHHQQPDENLFDLIISHPEMSSACELVFWVACNAWGNSSLNCEAAKCLYTGIVTDTGSFAFSNESPTLHEAAATLVSFHIAPAAIHNEISNDFSVARLRFFAHCLSNNLVVHEDKHFAYIHVSRKDLDQFGIKDSETEGLVNYTLKMRNIEVGALIKETPHNIRISFRSKKDFDVNTFARQFFNGGGHTKAAGGKSDLGLKETCTRIEELIIPLL